MSARRRVGWWHRNDAGASLFMVAAGMVFLLGACGLAIDLGALYVGRSEAQRAADAAALAGATVFITSGCTYSGTGCGSAQTDATNAAIATGNKNFVGGQSPNIQNTDVTFTAIDSVNPRINVTARQTVSTYFMKIFGVLSGNVSATATAEAYNPSDSAGGPTVCESCLKPFVVPNCDPNPNYTTPVNSLCPGPGTYTYFFDPNTGHIQHPGTYPNGAIGEPWVLHWNTVPSQYYELDLDAAPPSCTSGSGGSGYANNIRTCYNGSFGCGQQLCLLTGNKVGPTDAPLQDLIHASGDGFNRGQDTIDTSTGPPFTIRAGSRNPLVLSGQIAAGTPISSSDSIVTLPVYDGSNLCPGGSCGSTVTIKGYFQSFIQAVDHQGPDVLVYTIIMNEIGCGGVTGTCGSDGTISGGGSAIPVRLVQP